MLEILAPAGNAECADAAINNGANAIYLGLPTFSARQSANNFDETAFRAVVEKAHFCGVKVYVALNTLVKNNELQEFIDSLLFAWNEGADAIILQDALLGKYVHRIYPEIVLHLSTQAGVCNVNGAKFAKECGFSRVILARETPLSEIEKIAKIIETEAFVQGALCTCFSGQCYFSSFVGGNSGNRGRCKQPCRKLYSYDRNGNTEKSYALSLSDLSVGQEIEKYLKAGVVSFKIEGRMRRAEYVAAATRYYRALLDGNANTQGALSDLKRAYNRGNYTKGLAFGQDKRFLSPLVQGHMGEKVGVVKVTNGQYFVSSSFQPTQGDAFKILRGGVEIGGAIFLRQERKGFFVSAKSRLKNGDDVFITTDNVMSKRVLSAKKTGELTLDLCFEEGKRPLIKCGETVVQGDRILQTAQNRPLTKEDLKSCFLKTDGLPAEIRFERIDLIGNIFLPKSELNALRRSFYQAVSTKIAKGDRKELVRLEIIPTQQKGNNHKVAVISDTFLGVTADIAIYKPKDYNAPIEAAFKNGKFEKYLYYPPYCTSEDESAFEKLLSQANFDGVYAENYAAITFAKTHNLRLFVGTGLNLFNGITLCELLQDETLSYYALSKELNEQETQGIRSDKAFILSSGDIKLMDLCYCPFGKTCSVCDKKEKYVLTDENGRAFPVRRFVSENGECRFEVYNCSSLIGSGINDMGKLLDLSVTEDKTAAITAIEDVDKQKKMYTSYTSGHLKRGVL